MRLVIVTAWILLGAALAGGAYWGFLNTPESTAVALIVSALLVVLTMVLVAITINGAISLWVHGPSAAALRRSLTRVAAVVPALIIVAVFWWIAASIDTWVALRSGEINAWFIARFGWDDMSWLFTGIRYFTMWLRWVAGPLLAVSLMGGLAALGWRAGARPHWLRRGMRLRTLAVATLWFVVLIVLPWIYLVPWRPDWLPPSGTELAFIVGKLALAAMVMAAGVALMIYEATRAPLTPIDPY
jgi:hypothetical protein